MVVKGIEEAYRTGRGKVYVRARASVETTDKRQRANHCDRIALSSEQSQISGENCMSLSKIKKSKA